MSSALQSSSFELELETIMASAGVTPLTGGCYGDITLVHQPKRSTSQSGAMRVVRRYLVSQGCCGASSSAWRLAVEGTAEMGTPLVPWAAVALPLVGEDTQGKPGGSLVERTTEAGAGE